MAIVAQVSKEMLAFFLDNVLWHQLYVEQYGEYWGEDHDWKKIATRVSRFSTRKQLSVPRFGVEI